MKKQESFITEEPRKMMTLFLLFFPVLILAALPGTSILFFVIKLMIAFYEFIIIKSFIDKFYSVN